MKIVKLEDCRRENPELVEFVSRLIRKASRDRETPQERSVLAKITQILTGDRGKRF